MCYRDRTYCDFDMCANFQKCDRALTISIKRNAERIGLPICKFMDMPECYKYQYVEMTKSMEKRYGKHVKRMKKIYKSVGRKEQSDE